MVFSFADQEFKQLLKLVNTMINQQIKDYPEDQLIELAKEHIKIADVFLEQPDYLDKYIDFSKDELHYIRYLQDIINHNENKYIRILYASCGLLYVYLKELAFRSLRKFNQRNINITNYITFIEDFNSDDHDFNFYKEYGQNTLHFEILREFFNSANFQGFMAAESKLDEIKELTKMWEKSLDNKKKEILELESRLDKVKTTYDFLGLNKGFQQLYEQKKTELKERRDGYSTFGALLVFIPILVIIAIVVLILTGHEAKISSLWFLALPITTLMIFLFYFTRVGLQHVRSIRSQMMQLELRMALCQFIHNYAEDSEKLHSKNKAGFEKFENIIFSPLVSSDNKIPTTFDGMEQLVKLIGQFKSK